MKSSTRTRKAAGLLAILAAAACGTAAAEAAPRGPQPGVPGEAAGPSAAGARADTVPRRHSAADARFMRDMIGHHAQALEMARLVPTRTSRDDLRLLAERITVSQQDEIAIMRRWLERHGEGAPAADAHAGHGDAHAGHGDDHGDHARMPGMATPEELARLAAATGAEFDRLFLELMIRHHEGALAMVAELFATPGAGQAGEVFQLATDVDADQRAEIARMQRLREALSGAAPR